MKPRAIALFSLLILTLSAGAQTPAASPWALGWRGLRFSPSGYADLTLDYRSRPLGQGLGTPFAAIPYAGPGPRLASQWRLGVERSRVGMEASGRWAGTVVTGYTEADFSGQPLGAARLRLLYLDLRHGRWELMGGRAWSLLTPNRSGASPRPGDLELGAAADPSHLVGVAGGRRSQIRLIWHAAPRWTLGVSAEATNPFLGGSSGGSVPVRLPDGASGAAGAIPDLVAKLAYDSRPGGLHLEAAGLYSRMRVVDRASGRRAEAAGGGVLAAGEGPLARHLRWAASVYLGSAAGWFFSAAAPNLTISPEGAPHPIPASGGWAGLTWQLDRRDRLDFCYGDLLIQPRYTLTPVVTGYGYPGAPRGMNRRLQEIAVIAGHTLWSAPRAGSLQLRLQAAWLQRTPFAGAAPGPAHAQAGLGVLDLRYSLP